MVPTDLLQPPACILSQPMDPASSYNNQFINDCNTASTPPHLHDTILWSLTEYTSTGTPPDYTSNNVLRGTPATQAGVYYESCTRDVPYDLNYGVYVYIMTIIYKGRSRVGGKAPWNSWTTLLARPEHHLMSCCQIFQLNSFSQANQSFFLNLISLATATPSYKTSTYRNNYVLKH